MISLIINLIISVVDVSKEALSGGLEMAVCLLEVNNVNSTLVFLGEIGFEVLRYLFLYVLYATIIILNWLCVCGVYFIDIFSVLFGCIIELLKVVLKWFSYVCLFLFDLFIIRLHCFWIGWDFVLLGHVNKSLTNKENVNRIRGLSPRTFIRRDWFQQSRNRVDSVASVIAGLEVTEEMRERGLNWLSDNLVSLECKRGMTANCLTLDREIFEADFCGLQYLLGLIDMQGQFGSNGESISIPVSMYNRDVFDWLQDSYKLGMYELRPIFRDGEVDNLIYIYTITEESGLKWFLEYMEKHKLIGVCHPYWWSYNNYVMSNPDLNDISSSRWLGIVAGSVSVVQSIGGYTIEFHIDGELINKDLIPQFSAYFKEKWDAHEVTFPQNLDYGPYRWHIVNEESQKSFIGEFQYKRIGQLGYELFALGRHYNYNTNVERDSALFYFLNWLTPLVDWTAKPTPAMNDYLLESIKMGSYRLLRQDRFFLIEGCLQSDAYIGLINFTQRHWGFVEKWMYINLVLDEPLTMNFSKLDRKDIVKAMIIGNFNFVPGPYDAFRRNEIPNDRRNKALVLVDTTEEDKLRRKKLMDLIRNGDPDFRRNLYGIKKDK